MTGLLVFGQRGQVATEIARLAPDARFLGRTTIDLARPASCAEAIAALRPDMIINAAAWTAVDDAETNEAAARIVNAEAPAAMAREAARHRIPFLHLSTDYVFPGGGNQPWRPDDTTGPLSAYGRTKLAGEQAVRKAGGTQAILRTSWVFSAHGGNFLKTMLRAGQNHDSLNVVADQIGGPTPAAAIARACLVIVRELAATPNKSGTYHFSGVPDVSWADFAREIFRQAGLLVAVNDIATAEWPSPAPRPLNSRLDNSKTSETFGIGRPDWCKAVSEILQELGQGKAP